MLNKNLIALSLMELFAGLARGAYLVCIGWTTLIVTNDVAKVGQVFIVAMLTNIISGPLIGTIVDRTNRKFLAILAHLFIALPLVALGWALSTSMNVTLFWFFLTVIGVNASRMLYQISHDGLIHANVSRAEMVHAIARFRSIHLLAAAGGTLAAGIIIEQFSPSVGFAFTAAMSLLLILPVAFVASANPTQDATGLSGFVADLVGGITLFRRNKKIQVIAILAAITLPVGQLANAILSSFIRDDLGKASDAFGFVDAAWPIGGMIAALLLSLRLGILSSRYTEYLFGVLVGLITIAFSMTTSILALALLHAAMGCAVWMCRIVLDSRILQSCKTENVGRTKVYVEMVFSSSALIMCLSPTLIKLPTTSGYFLFWGGAITIGTVAVLLWQRTNIAKAE